MSDTNKINILFRLRSMETGGVQKVLTDIMTNLPENKYNVTLLLNLYQGAMLPLIPKNVKVKYIGKGKEFFSKNKLVYYTQLVARRLQLQYYQWFPNQLYLKLDETPDVEVAFTSTEYNTVLQSPIKNSKKVAWFHADIRDATFVREESLKIAKQLEEFDNQVFVSKQTQQIIEDTFDITYPNGTVIYNPFNQEEIKEKAQAFKVDYNSNNPVFLSIGRFINRKGYHKLVEAHAKVINKGLPHKIIVLGTGPNKADLEKQVQELGVEDSFLFYGTVPNPYPYFVAADYFILPSKSEAYPLVIGEALVLEKPIISTRAGGVPEMMDNEVNGLIVDYSVEEMAVAMEIFLTDTNLVEQIKKNNKKAYQRFNNQEIFNQIDEVLTKPK